jgi:hypothetical protein
MKIIPFTLIFLLLLSSLALAQKVTLGVQPSEFSLDFYKSKDYRVELAFFNELGDTDAYYTLTPDACLSHFIREYQKEVLVPKGTKRLENPVKTWVSFERDNTGNKTCYLQVSAKAVGVNESATIGIKPTVSVRVLIYQGFSEGEYTTTGSSVGLLPQINLPQLPKIDFERNTTTTTAPTGATTTTLTETKGKEGFNFNLLLIGGAVVLSGVLVYFFRDYLIGMASSLFSFFFISLLLVPLVTAQGINVTVNVTAPPPPPPPLRFSAAFVLGGQIIAPILLSIVIVLVAQKYLLGTVELSVQGLVKYLLAFIAVIVIVIGFSYVFSIL